MKIKDKVGVVTGRRGRDWPGGGRGTGNPRIGFLALVDFSEGVREVSGKINQQLGGRRQRVMWVT